MGMPSEERNESPVEFLRSPDQPSSPSTGLSSATEEDEESIEEYMARLMVRVRGEVAEAEASAGITHPRLIA